ncbi:MAG: glycosyltransferase family 4 protein [Stenotrophobium sp.]
MAKIWLHDSAGHPFLSEFSRYLATRGHEVIYSYLPEFVSPKGRLTPSTDDPARFRIHQVRSGRKFPKYNYLKRWLAERQYGLLLAQAVLKEKPDVVVGANISLDMGVKLQVACSQKNMRYVHWLQDVYGHAIGHILGKRLGPLGHILAAYYTMRESRLLRRSHKVIAITEDFLPFLTVSKVAPQRITVIENWAPLLELPVQPKRNLWARQYDLQDKFVFMYSGTMGMKHNPGLLVNLCQSFATSQEVRIVVVSEGLGADWLKAQQRALKLDNLLVLPFQPYAQVPAMMGSADVLLVILEQDAGTYSVPSKTLSYLCAARPILMSGPTKNLAARTIESADAGLVCASDEGADWVPHAKTLYDNATLRLGLGINGRRYAEAKFDLLKIAERFEKAIG